MATGSREIGRQLWLHRKVIGAVLTGAVLWELAAAGKAGEAWELWAAWDAGEAAELCRAVICTVFMVPAAVLDSIYKKLYHRLSACMVFAGLITALALDGVWGVGGVLASAGGGMLFLLIMLTVFLLSRGGMGFGDVCFAAGLGVFIGWERVPLAFCLTFGAGGLVAAGVYICSAVQGREPERQIPLGPFLAAGAFLSLLYGQEIMAWLWYAGL